MARLEGLEPPTHCFVGFCSIQLSQGVLIGKLPLKSLTGPSFHCSLHCTAKPTPYRCTRLQMERVMGIEPDDQLEGWDSTIELHPHKYVFRNR